MIQTVHPGLIDQTLHFDRHRAGSSSSDSVANPAVSFPAFSPNFPSEQGRAFVDHVEEDIPKRRIWLKLDNPPIPSTGHLPESRCNTLAWKTIDEGDRAFWQERLVMDEGPVGMEQA